MKTPHSHILFTFIYPNIFFTSTVVLTLHSTFNIWMMMELNMLTFVTMLALINNKYIEVTIKYFLIQVISSSMFIFFSLMTSYELFNITNKYINTLFYSFMNISMMIKLGCAPFHGWVMEISKNLNWSCFLIMMTWQKIVPLYVIYLYMNNVIIYMFSLLSCFIGSINGLNQQDLRLIMIYSSTNHLGWILMCMMKNTHMTMNYFSCYMLMTTSLILIFNKLNTYYLNELYMIKPNNLLKIIISSNMFSMSSMPPMLGFTMKWWAIQSMYKFNSMILLFMMMLSVITFIFYIRICLNFLMTSNMKHKLSFKSLNYHNWTCLIIINFSYFWLMKLTFL